MKNKEVKIFVIWSYILIFVAMLGLGVGIYSSHRNNSKNIEFPQNSSGIKSPAQLETDPTCMSANGSGYLSLPLPASAGTPGTKIVDATSGVQNAAQPEMAKLIMSVIEIESGGNPRAKNGKSQGLMQINGGSFEPVENVTAGSKILANLIAKSMNTGEIKPIEIATNAENILHHSLTAYNRGWAGANRYKAKTGTFTSEYSKKVLKMYNKFKELEKK